MNAQSVSRMVKLLWGCLLIAAYTPSVMPNPTKIFITPTATSTVVSLVITDSPPPTVTPRYVSPTKTPLTPTPSPSDTLTICSGDQPDTLYLYDGSMLATNNVLEAIYDGPIDSNGYSYQPVILEKLPSLADGDAVIQTAMVQDGDFVIDNAGKLIVLSAGDVICPAGCRFSDCAIAYQGGDIQMDQMSATFTLLDGLKWSDGEPLTAQDSVYSFHLASDPNTPNKFLEERTASYEALDDRTTRWTALPGFLDQTYFLNFWHPLPEHLWESYTATELLEAEISTRKPIGWGPYILDDWNPNTGAFRFHRNPYYFRADEGLPKFEHLIIRFGGQGSDALSQLLDGKCDIQTQSAHIEELTAEFLELDKAHELQLITSPGTVWEHADFGIIPYAYEDGYQPDVDRPDFFGDVRTRRAIAMCMDRKAIADALFLGLSEVVHSYVPTFHPLFNADAPQIAYNPEQGKLLLDEIGWIDDGDPATSRVAQGIPRVPDGTPLSFNFWTTESTLRQQATQILADSLLQCGIEAKLDYWKADEFFAAGPVGPIFGRQFDMTQFAWLSGVTPSCDLYLSENIAGPPDVLNPEGTFRHADGWEGSNVIGYSNPTFDEACRRALSLLPGELGYEDAHREAQAIWMTDLPSIPLYLRIKMGAARADFCGYQLDPTADSDTWNIEAFGYGTLCLK